MLQKDEGAESWMASECPWSLVIHLYLSNFLIQKFKKKNQKDTHPSSWPGPLSIDCMMAAPSSFHKTTTPLPNGKDMTEDLSPTSDQDLFYPLLILPHR
jgi:hypothetical protein